MKTKCRDCKYFELLGSNKEAWGFCKYYEDDNSLVYAPKWARLTNTISGALHPDTLSLCNVFTKKD